MKSPEEEMRGGGRKTRLSGATGLLPTYPPVHSRNSEGNKGSQEVLHVVVAAMHASCQGKLCTQSSEQMRLKSQEHAWK